MSTRGATRPGRRSRITGALIGCACATAMALPSAASADVPPGFDLFETSPENTAVNFNGVIPGGFFDPGSNPFTGTVFFGGRYLNTFNGKDVGTADTVVQRPALAPLGPAFPDTAIVPIEIVALNLVSVQPITVTYGAAPNERWDVAIGLQPIQAQGQVQLNQQNAQGGTFNVPNFPINVIVTFTRLSDGATRTQTLGVNLQTSNAPWRTGGCVPPALRIAGLNEIFCPAQAPGSLLIPVVFEQPPFVEHEVLPVQPRLEHFQCYRTARRPFFQPRNVTLSDQFGSRGARIIRRKELCNPVQKNGEKFLNTRSHLQCYSTVGGAVNRSVAVRNQFGSQRLRVLTPQRLCLPSKKHKPGKPFRNITASNRLDHFQCYNVRHESQLLGRNTTSLTVTLRDQFGKRQRKVGAAFRLCAPVKKTANGRILRPVRHLVCYKLTGRKRNRYVIKNQFETRRGLRTLRRDSLCVPSVKQVL